MRMRVVGEKLRAENENESSEGKMRFKLSRGPKCTEFSISGPYPLV